MFLPACVRSGHASFCDTFVFVKDLPLTCSCFAFISLGERRSFWTCFLIPCLCACFFVIFSYSTARVPKSLGLNVGVHVLVVDDNTICQKVMCRMLSNMGCTTEVASNGLEVNPIIVVPLPSRAFSSTTSLLGKARRGTYQRSPLT